VELDVEPYLYVHEGEDAVKHLLSVAGGLDSMVLGETEIPDRSNWLIRRRRRQSSPAACEPGFFRKRCKRRKRSAPAPASAGARLRSGVWRWSWPRDLRGDLSQRTVMIIGAGKMGEACLRHLAKRGVKSVLVSNRSFDRAQRWGRVRRAGHPLDDCFEAMVEADIVVSFDGRAPKRSCIGRRLKP